MKRKYIYFCGPYNDQTVARSNFNTLIDLEIEDLSSQRDCAYSTDPSGDYAPFDKRISLLQEMKSSNADFFIQDEDVDSEIVRCNGRFYICNVLSDLIGLIDGENIDECECIFPTAKEFENYINQLTNVEIVCPNYKSTTNRLNFDDLNKVNKPIIVMSK